MAAAVAGITLATAQTPTYDTARRQPASQTVKPTPQRQETVQPSRSHSSQEANYQRDMVKIQASDVPTELRSTLDGAEYKGWESGTFYRNKTNDGYLLEINNGSNVKTYRFDKSGKRLQTNSTIPQK